MSGRYPEPVTAMECALLGLAGATVIEVFQFAADLSKSKRWPWRRRAEIAPLVIAVILRLSGATLLTFLVSADGRISSASAAGALGMAAPVVAEKLLKTARQLANTLGDGVDAG